MPKASPSNDTAPAQTTPTTSPRALKSGPPLLPGFTAASVSGPGCGWRSGLGSDAIARELGAETIVGEYLPTPKNGVVANLYSSLGFVPSGDGRWTLDVRPGATVPAYETQIEPAPQAVSS